MVRLLNKKVILFLVFGLSFAFVKAQEGNEYENTNDYKDPKQFEKFRKKRMIIGAWQINQLKTGALVVKLKTNINQVKAFKSVGKTEKANGKIAEAFIINKNIMMGYRDNYKFSKIYFIYSNSTDSLLNGARSGIFLDTNLTIDPNIVMDEKFYLIAEKDFAYNSSIGFVKEDSARIVTEHGNPTGNMYDIVVKNKYGHQLKRPFPYLALFTKKISGYVGPVPMYYKYEDNKITYGVDKTQIEDMKATVGKKFKSPPKGFKTLLVDKGDAYEFISNGINQFNYNLNQYYKESPTPELDKIDPEIKKFFY